MEKRKYYVYLVFVVAVWGVIPNLIDFYYDYMSTFVYAAISAVIAAGSFTILGWKKRHLLTKKRIAIALTTGVFYSLAILVQIIGLQYTTPAMFAFLENTSCVAVPVLMFVLKGKRVHPLVAFSSVLCLVGCFVLSGANIHTPIGAGEILCALAGVFYAVNIVGTGEYAKDIPAVLYLMIQKWVLVVTSVGIMLAAHFIAPEGIALQSMVFRWTPGLLLLMVVSTLISGTLCWILRTKVTQNIDVTLVSIVMPMSAVITMAESVLLGTDVLTLQLVTGAGMILLAVILSALGDLKEQKKITCHNA